MCVYVRMCSIWSIDNYQLLSHELLSKLCNIIHMLIKYSCIHILFDNVQLNLNIPQHHDIHNSRDIKDGHVFPVLHLFLREDTHKSSFAKKGARHVIQVSNDSVFLSFVMNIFQYYTTNDMQQESVDILK